MMGLMGVILIGALFSVGKSLFSGDGSAQPAAKAAATAAESSPEGPRPITGVLPASLRDPFSSSLMRRVALQHSGGGSPAAPAAPLAPVPARPRRSTGAAPPLTPVPQTLHVAPATVRGPVDMVAARTAAEEDALVRAFRVTAIVMGESPYAVLEAAGAPPRAMHKAEAYRSLRLVSITPSEIVLRGRSGIWTLPLATPDNDSGAAETRN